MSVSFNTGIDISNLIPNTTYTFNIYSLNQNNQYDTNAVIQKTITTLPLLNKVDYNLTNPTTIDISVNGALATFQPSYSTDNTTYTNFGSTVSYSNPYTIKSITGLTENTRYYLKVKPYNSFPSEGSTYTINDVSCVTLASITGTPTTTANATSISIVFNTTGNKVDLDYGLNSSSDYSLGTIVNYTSGARISGLVSDTTYKFRLKPYNSIGNMYISNISPYIFTETTLSRIPLNITANTLTYTTYTSGTNTVYVYDISSPTTSTNAPKFKVKIADISASILIIGGGGGGGGTNSGNWEGAGGGGAGEVVYISSYTFVNTTDEYTLNVGAGGDGGNSGGNNGSNGSDSNIVKGTAIITGAKGGGYGSYNSTGGTGGSSGGSSGAGSDKGSTSAGTSYSPLGGGTSYANAGGSGKHGNGSNSDTQRSSGGGGGGAGAAGDGGNVNSSSNTTSGGNGGVGYQFKIKNGTDSVYYGGGGGGGGGGSASPSGGSGGGGAGGNRATTGGNVNGTDGTDGYGGGGGGAASSGNGKGGKGGCGRIILSFSVSND